MEPACLYAPHTRQRGFFLKKEVWEGFPKLPVAEEKAIVFLDTFGHIICH